MYGNVEVIPVIEAASTDSSLKIEKLHFGFATNLCL